MIKHLFLVALLLASLMAVSCQSEDETTQSSNADFAEFANVYNSAMSDIFSIEVGKSDDGDGAKDTQKGESLDSLRQIYIIPNSQFKMEEQFAECTLADFAESMQLVDATLSTFNDGTAVDSVLVSEAEAREKLAPMVRQAWKYLRGKGMTTAEIRGMLAANDADETELVPLMLALMESEGGFERGLTACAPPSPNAHHPAQDRQLDLERVGKCALQAIGVDAAFELLGAGVRKFSKELAVKLFACVAGKYAGPVTVIIMVADFALCLGKA